MELIWTSSSDENWPNDREETKHFDDDHEPKSKWDWVDWCYGTKFSPGELLTSHDYSWEL